MTLFGRQVTRLAALDVRLGAPAMPPIRTILALTDSQWAKLREAHALLTQVTAAHAPMCLCELCRACALASTVDAGYRVVTALIEE